MCSAGPKTFTALRQGGQAGAPLQVEQTSLAQQDSQHGSCHHNSVSRSWVSKEQGRADSTVTPELWATQVSGKTLHYHTLPNFFLSRENLHSKAHHHP